ncbi:MAG: tripartite tricarboxylate transporter substrate binding protein [Ottowia sp.]|uniref:Bug family tripartite tricarboxylate transporter substrate binding protein n=1 Tax=Ottowia sp. TaxID=1898956 RepID=UPI003C76149B
MTISETSKVSKHKLARRTALRAAAAGAAALAAPGVFAQAWPAKPIRLIVPFVAGGGADATARLIAGKLAERLGQQIFIDNKAGGNTIIGVQDLRRAPPDGHTLIWTMDQTFVLNPSLYNRLPYDPIKDFTPVALAITSPITVIGRTRPGDAQSIQEVVQRAKAQPGKLNVGSAAILAHIALAEFSQLAGIEAARITYKGSAEVAQGLIAGDVSLAFDGLAPYVQFVKTGRARILAVTSARRFGALPEVPTLDESGYKGMDLSVWFGVAGPAGMPAAIAQRLAQETEWAVRQSDVIEKLGTFGFEPASAISPAIMAQRIVRDGERYAPVIRKLGFKLD